MFSSNSRGNLFLQTINNALSFMLQGVSGGRGILRKEPRVRTVQPSLWGTPQTQWHMPSFPSQPEPEKEEKIIKLFFLNRYKNLFKKIKTHRHSLFGFRKMAMRRLVKVYCGFQLWTICWLVLMWKIHWDMVWCAWDSSTQKVEAGGWWVLSRHRLYSNTPNQWGGIQNEINSNSDVRMSRHKMSFYPNVSCTCICQPLVSPLCIAVQLVSA